MVLKTYIAVFNDQRAMEVQIPKGLSSAGWDVVHNRVVNHMKHGTERYEHLRFVEPELKVHGVFLDLELASSQGVSAVLIPAGAEADVEKAKDYLRTNRDCVSLRVRNMTWMEPMKFDNIQYRIHENSFIDLFKPETTEEGHYFLQRDWPDDEDLLKKSISQNRCWTVLEAEDGPPVISSGHHIVNRLYSIITTNSYSPAEYIETYED